MCAKLLGPIRSIMTDSAPQPAKPELGHPVHLFIDTSAFQTLAFAFDSTLFKALIEKVKAGLIRVLLSHVTQLEVAKRMKVLETEARAGINRAKQLKQLLGQPSDGLDGQFDWDTVEKAVQERWAQFQKDAEVMVLPVGDKDGAAVVAAYFNRVPPFSGKKKDEFRDAFAIAALKRYAKEKSIRIAVVSDDGDFKAACVGSEALAHFAGIPEVLQIVAEKEAAAEILDLIAKHQVDLEKLIVETFADRGFYWDSDDDHDAEVTAVDVDQVDSMNLSVIAMDEDNAEIAGTVTISFQVLASYPDPDSMYRDSETKTVFHMGNVHVGLSARVTVPVSFSVDLEGIKASNFDFDDLVVNEGGDIWFSDVVVERIREDNSAE